MLNGGPPHTKTVTKKKGKRRQVLSGTCGAAITRRPTTYPDDAAAPKEKAGTVLVRYPNCTDHRSQQVGRNTFFARHLPAKEVMPKEAGTQIFFLPLVGTSGIHMVTNLRVQHPTSISDGIRSRFPIRSGYCAWAPLMLGRNTFVHDMDKMGRERYQRWR